MKNKKVKIFIISIGILMAGILYILGCGLTDSGTGEVFQLDEISETAGSTGQEAAQEAGQEAEQNTDPKADLQAVQKEGGGDGETMKTESATEALRIVVHVCGEVAKPGVYEMPQGSRIFEAVEQAGGFTDQAASDCLNLARPLTDGMKITVPDEEAAKTFTEAEAVQQAAPDGGNIPGGEAKVDINTAAKEQLMTLRGIGEARALDIIAYRQQNGPFKKIEDIMGVSGIKEAAFQKIKENITV